MSKLKLLAAGLLVAGWFACPGLASESVEAGAASAALAGAPAFARGDANDDGEITLADAIHVVAYLFARGPTPRPSEESGDANCDSRVDPLDVVYLINYTLRGGPKPKCPA